MAPHPRARIESLELRRLLSASISGIIYQDIGAVGSLQPGDPALAGWTVYLDLNHDSTLDAGDPSAVTDASGRYTFSAIAAGTYDVREEPVTGFLPVPDEYKTVSVADGQSLANVDIGNQNLVNFNYPGVSAAQDSVNNYGATTPTDAPSSGMAISGKFIVAVNNNSISNYNRFDSTQLSTQSLGQFFLLSPLALPNAAAATDPQVFYDPGIGKFFVAAIANTSTGSELLTAGSQRLAPNSGAWRYHNIDVQASTGEDVFASNLSISFSGNAVYLTANLVNSSGTFVGSRLWIIGRKSAFSLTQTKLVDYIYDPSTQVSLSDLSNLDVAHYSSKSVLNIGVSYLVASSDNGGLADVIRIQNPGAKAKFILYSIATPTDISVSSAVPAAAAQPDGAPSIDTTNDAIDAAWRNHYFWIADTLDPTSGADAGNATVYWFQFNIPNFALLDDGSVSGSAISSGASTFAPSISIDRDQYMAIAFSASGPGLDPGSYAVGRRTPDPLHTVRPAYTLDAGVDPYTATTDAAGLVDWGSNQIVLDPISQQRFWADTHAAGDPSSNTGPWSQTIIGFELPPKKFPVKNS